MLGNCQPMTFVPAAHPDKAKAFYSGILGLELIQEDQFMILLSAAGISLMIQKVQEFTPQPFTILGWRVNDIQAAVRELTGKGVVFERYKGMEQDQAGIWTVPGGAAKVCWFKDPDGNTLSLTQSA